MALPKIQSAIPKRRYQFGEFMVTLLSDISSADTSYLYIAAVLREGNTAPEVYITCEPDQAGGGCSYRVRVLSAHQEHLISEDRQWKNEQRFCDFALQGVKQMFDLADETPILLS